MKDEFKKAWRGANPKIRTELLYRTAVHESGHAVARWALDQMHYLGRHTALPYLRYVAVSLDGVEGSRGMHAHLNGVCAADPCFFWPTRAPLPRDYLMRQDARRRACADIVYTMAGPIAEAIHDGHPYEDWLDWLWSEDDRASLAGCKIGTDSWQVQCMIAVLGRRWRLHTEGSFSLADQIVRNHQPRIHALAEALTERGLIDGEEVEAILERCAQ